LVGKGSLGVQIVHVKGSNMYDLTDLLMEITKETFGNNKGDILSTIPRRWNIQ